MHLPPKRYVHQFCGLFPRIHTSRPDFLTSIAALKPAPPQPITRTFVIWWCYDLNSFIKSLEIVFKKIIMIFFQKTAGATVINNLLLISLSITNVSFNFNHLIAVIGELPSPSLYLSELQVYQIQ